MRFIRGVVVKRKEKSTISDEIPPPSRRIDQIAHTSRGFTRYG